MSNIIKNEPENIEKIIDLVLSKFSHPNDKIAVEEQTKTIEPIIKELSELYVKIAKYLNEDYETAFNLLEFSMEKIITYIKKREKINFIKEKINQKTLTTLEYKNIIPKNISFTIQQINLMIKLEDSSKSYKDFIKLIYTSVTNIFKWFIKYYLDDSLQFSLIYHRAEKTFFHDKCDDEIKVFEIDELKKLGWSTEKIVTNITDLINKNLPERSSSRASIEAFTDRLKVQPETRRMLFDKDKIVGYWQLYPLKENFFERSVEGNLTSNEITPKSIYTYLIPGRYNIEFGATVLENNYRKTPIFKALLYSIFEYLERLSLEKVFINEIKTETSTDDGASLVESIGLKFYKTHPDGKAKIYRGFIIDLIEKDYLRDFGLLKKLYLQEFK